MALPNGISLLPITSWQNGHQNFTVQLQKDASFNMRLPFAFTEQEKNYQATTKNFQWLIQHAMDNGLRLRAMGNGWSFSDVAVCKGGIVDTRPGSCVLSSAWAIIFYRRNTWPMAKLPKMWYLPNAV
jgi:hypothetical protein